MSEYLIKEQMDNNLYRSLMDFYHNEKLGFEVYERLSNDPRLSEKNGALLHRIAELEKNHVRILEKYIGSEPPKKNRIERLLLKTRLLGFTFTIKRMEMIQEKIITPAVRRDLGALIPELEEIFIEEDMIDEEIITLLEEERLIYVSSMVLGLNDALVEFTGAIAGFTFAMRNSKIIAMAGIITGISASLSMAASEYLSTRADGKDSKKNPFKAAIITGVAYVVTVMCMVLPYLLLPKDDYFYALGIMLSVVIVIIAFFSYYVSVTRSERFIDHFRVMAVVSLTVAFISFIIGVVVKKALGIDL